MTPLASGVAQAIEHLKTLHSGDAGVVEVINCGRAAVPALRSFLFAQDRSGIYQPRCRAVEALAVLGAYDVLSDFLRASHEVEDPIAQMGEDAVVNAAALALSHMHENWVYELLLDLADRHALPGVIAALATFEHPAIIPILIEALGEDDARLAAETALRRLGARAQLPLVQAALLPRPANGPESCSSIRRRRAALGLLIALGGAAHPWPALRHLIVDQDKKLSVLACRLCLQSGPASEHGNAVSRLISLLPGADWRLAAEIEDALDPCLERMAKLIAASIEAVLSELSHHSLQGVATRTLLDLKERAEATLKRAPAKDVTHPQGSSDDRSR